MKMMLLQILHIITLVIQIQPMKFEFQWNAYKT